MSFPIFPVSCEVRWFWNDLLHDFSMIFVGYSSLIFSDFDGFPQISQFLHTALTASTRRIGSKCVHFRGVLWIRAIFGSKSTKFRRLGQSVTGTCPKAVRAWKSPYFGKYHRDVLETRFFDDFCRVLIDDFLRFWRIFTDFAIFAHDSNRFHEANRFHMRSFSWIWMDPSNFRMKIHKISALGAKCYRYVTKSDPGVKITLFWKVPPRRARNTIFRWFL